jgi:hypothetical protein
MWRLDLDSSDAEVKIGMSYRQLRNAGNLSSNLIVDDLYGLIDFKLPVVPDA